MKIQETLRRIEVLEVATVGLICECKHADQRSSIKFPLLPCTPFMQGECRACNPPDINVATAPASQPMHLKSSVARHDGQPALQINAIRTFFISASIFNHKTGATISTSKGEGQGRGTQKTPRRKKMRCTRGVSRRLDQSSARTSSWNYYRGIGITLSSRRTVGKRKGRRGGEGEAIG